jgi:uncharacterized protein YggU (UPF0235/DUF167 family)
VTKLRIEVHVRPGSSATRVGGDYDGRLVVRVREKAVDGAANAAVQLALATALNLPPRAISLTQGATRRAKVIEVSVPDGAIGEIRAVLQHLQHD